MPFLESFFVSIDSLPLLGSVFLGVFGVLTVLWIFPKIGLLDFPHRYNLSRKPIPYPAGIAFVVMFLLALFLFFPFSQENIFPLFGFILGFILLAVISFIDDRKQISPLIRLAIQSVAALCVIVSGTVISFLTNPLSPDAFVVPFWIGGTLTFIWILGFINATNWLDGVPNLTLSSGALGSFTLGMLSLSLPHDQHDLSLLCFMFTAILLPFILTNISKTRFILGDTGSMLIGFSLAVFSLFAGGKMATVLIVMSIPIFDSIFVFLTRIFQKKSPLQGGDKLHLHDTLLEKGWKEFYIFLLYFIISLVLGTSVLFLGTWGKLILLFVFFIIFMILRILLLEKKI